MATHSTILQWMISRTKKRLSKSNYYVIPAYVIALSGLLVTCAYLVQSIRPSSSYGVVYSQFPVMYEPVEDPLDDKITEFEHEVVENTPVVILRLDSFVFGHIDSFTKEFYRADNKFLVEHTDGAPNVGKLLENLSKWQNYVNKQKEESKVQPLILYPVSEIPMPIVIKVMHMLSESKKFSQVILATDLI